MSSFVKLPTEMEEDILSRLPPSTLVRFRCVCKRWKNLSKEDWFINKYLSRSRPQFIYLTKSKIMTIDIINLDGVDPTIDFHELAFPADIPYRDLIIINTVISPFDGFLFCDFVNTAKEGGALWNPWLREIKWLQNEHTIDKRFRVCGVGYDNTRSDKVYKLMGYFLDSNHVAIYNFESHAFKFMNTFEIFPAWKLRKNFVSLNGNLYWTNCKHETSEFCIRCCDFSRDIVKLLCPLPFQLSRRDEFSLTVKGDGLSLLNLCCVTEKIEIWVTKDKIDVEGETKWINMMTFQPFKFPKLLFPAYGLSFFIYQKTLIMCTADGETGVVNYIYIIRRDMFRKIPIDYGHHGVHCVISSPSISRFL